VLGDSLIAPLLRDLFDFGNDKWSGTVAELLTVLGDKAGPKISQSDGWPKVPRGLTSHLKRLAPNLRRAGINVVFDGHSRAGNKIRLKMVAPGHSQRSHIHDEGKSQGKTQDRRERCGERCEGQGDRQDANVHTENSEKHGGNGESERCERSAATHSNGPVDLLGEPLRKTTEKKPRHNRDPRLRPDEEYEPGTFG
jgi:hypothetical protein